MGYTTEFTGRLGLSYQGRMPLQIQDFSELPKFDYPVGLGFSSDKSKFTNHFSPVQILEYINIFSTKCHMKRDNALLAQRTGKPIGFFGDEGEYFVDFSDDYGWNPSPDVVDHNKPPKTQPGLWCQWIIGFDAKNQSYYLEWDGNEKFYYYVEWLQYLIDNFLSPTGWILNGTIEYRGEEMEDIGIIKADENVITVKELDFE